MPAFQYKLKTVIMTKGIPASGKSTWAKEQLKKEPSCWKRINKDDLRAMLDDGYWSRKEENIMNEMRMKMLEVALMAGYNVIIDDTNFKKSHFDDVCKIAELVGNVRVIEKYFPIELNEALQRNKNRESSVPEHVIKNFWNKHIKGKTVKERDVYLGLRQFDTVGISRKPIAVIFDVDGTLALNTSGRSPFDGSRVLEDTAYYPIVDLYKMMKKEGHKIIIFSGREDTCKINTEKWLQKYEIEYDEIYLRKEKDYRKDYIIKREMYENFVKDKYYVKYIVDDRVQVVRMWRRLGLTVLQVNDLWF